MNEILQSNFHPFIIRIILHFAGSRFIAAAVNNFQNLFQRLNLDNAPYPCVHLGGRGRDVTRNLRLFEDYGTIMSRGKTS